MKLNPEIHHRRSLRLKEYDYSKAGLYFITICCEGRICRFGDIRAGVNPAPTMILNKLGQIASDEWMKLPQRFQNLELDVFQIMPNHMHGIMILNESHDGAGVNPTPTPAPTVGAIIGAYKSTVSNECLKIFKLENRKMDKLWQRNYYEHIIRDDISFLNISEYIINNPVNCANDDWSIPW